MRLKTKKMEYPHFILVSKFIETFKSKGIKATFKKSCFYIIKCLFKKHEETRITEEYRKRFEPDQNQLLQQKILAKQFRYTPLLSAIIPVYKVPRDVLNETIKSLEQQSYENWQACIVWSDTENEVDWQWLKARTKNDGRFIIELLSYNKGISSNSNEALKLATGDFIALLDHDDSITPWAFFEVVSLLQKNPQLDFIYSDKDSITADGNQRLNPLFKPNLSPEMLHSANYLTHLNIIRTSLIRSIGGWRTETDGAQDWDLFFRIIEQTKNITRVPLILYHWRILPTSVASGLQAKPYAASAQLRIQQDYFLRNGLPATIIPTDVNTFRISWPIKPKSVDIIVYQTATSKELENLLIKIEPHKEIGIQRIYVIYRYLDKDIITLLSRLWQNQIIFIYQQSVNWLVALQAVANSNLAQTILLLDGRIDEFSENLIEELSAWINHHPDIAWISPIAMNKKDIIYESGRVVSKTGQSSPLFKGRPFPSYGYFGGSHWYRNTSACSPYAVAMKSRDIKQSLSETESQENNEPNFSIFCQKLASGGRRGLINPFGKIYFKKSPEKNWSNNGELFHSDPYFHPAFCQVNPLRISK